MSYEQEMQQRWISRRDANAFTELVQRHAGMVFATCRRVLGDATEAEDVAQECFMELAGATKVVKPSLGGWLHRVAVFRSLNRIRADHRRKLREKAYAETHPASAEPQWDDIRPHLDEAIAALPENLRLAVIARFLEGKSQEEVAKALGVSRSTAQYRMERGVEEIRGFLKGKGIVAAATALVALLEARAVEAAPATLVSDLGQRALAASPVNASIVSSGGWGVTSLTGKVASGVLLLLTLSAAGVWHASKNPIIAPEAVGQVNTASIVAAPPPPMEEPSALVLANLTGSLPTTQNQPSSAPAMPAVVGRVYSSDNGEGLRAFRVVAYRSGTKPDGKIPPLATAMTDENGEYRLDGLGAGSYDIHTQDSVASFSFMRKSDQKKSTTAYLDAQAMARLKATGPDIVADISIKTERCLGGYVVRPDGSPAPGVTVWAWGDNAKTTYWAARESDSLGRFILMGLEPGCQLYLEAANHKFASQKVGPVSIHKGAMPDVTINLRDAARIEGVVESAGGKPVPFATAWLRPDSGPVVRPQFLYSDENGHFQVAGLAAENYDVILGPLRLNPDKMEYAILDYYWGVIEETYPDTEPAARLNLSAGERREGLRIQFPHTGISGRVTDDAGHPLSGVKVYVLESAEALTDEEGKYTLEGAPRGTHALTAVHDDYRGARREEIAVGTRGVDFVMEMRGLVEGRVVNARTREPITQFELHRERDRPYSNDMDQWFKEHKDPEGRFSYKPGLVTQRVFARAAGYAVNSVLAADVRAGQPPTQITIALEPARRVDGVVVGPDDKAVSGALIFQGSVPGHPGERDQSALARSGGEGQFTLESLPPESVTVVAWHKDWGYGSATAPAESKNEPFRIVLRGSGGVTVHISEGGKPLPEVAVSVMELPEAAEGDVGGNGPGAITEGRTDVSGTCQFIDLPPGRVKITCAMGDRSRFLTVDIATDSMKTYSMSFPALTAALEGRVFLGDGAPAANATLTVTARGGWASEIYHVEADPEGFYRFEALPAGPLNMMVADGEGIPVVFEDVLKLEDGEEFVHDFNIAEGTLVDRPTGGEVQVIVELKE